MSSIDQNKLAKSASYLAVITAIIIMFLKLYGYLSTESQSILASLIDSMLDISSSVLNLIALRIALLPPDNDHRFGHEKFQDLAVFSQSIFFFASCLFIIFSAGKALIAREQVENIHLGTNVMVLSTILTALLVLYQTFVLRLTNSKIIEADKLHYFTDLLSNCAVLVSIYLSQQFWYIDAITSLLIAAYIIVNSRKLFLESLKNLVDEELPKQDKEKIIKIVSTFKQAKAIHELKTRNAGNKIFIQFHLEMPRDLSLLEAHNFSDEIAAAIRQEFPEAEILIHQDPVGIEQDVEYREQF